MSFLVFSQQAAFPISVPPSMAADDYNPVSVPPFVVFNIYSGTAKVALFLSIIMKCKPCPPFNGGTTSASPIL